MNGIFTGCGISVKLEQTLNQQIWGIKATILNGNMVDRMGSVGSVGPEMGDIIGITNNLGMKLATKKKHY